MGEVQTRPRSASWDANNFLLPDPTTTKILIGEVSPINSTVIKKFLTKLGYSLIVEVDNGMDAISYAEKEKFNIIFLDLRMPVIGGVEATKLIRKHEKEKKRKISTTIVGLTAVYTDKQNEIHYRNLGMDCVLRMPLHIGDLKNVLEKYGHPGTIYTLKQLTMMFITNHPHLFQYTTNHPSSIFYKEKEFSLPSDILDSLHEMKDSSPNVYKYPNFQENTDHSEILCVVSNDYYPLKEGLVKAIDADDMGAVRRTATAMAAILRYVSPDAEAAALEMITCKDCAQALEFLEALTQYMDTVWD